MKELNIKMGPKIFKPGLTSSLITLLILPLFVYLGFWQLHRFDEKKELLRQWQDHAKRIPLLGTKDFFSQNLLQYKFHRLKTKGYFLNEKSILLDNQIFKGQVGYLVLTPFKPNESGSLILVDRGFVPSGFDRQKLPSITPIFGEQTITGILYAPSLGIQLKNQSEKIKNSWPENALRIQTINYSELSIILQNSVNHLLLKIEDKSPYQYYYIPLSLGIPANRHLGYAVQWFTMSIAALIYYCVISLRHG